MITPTAVFVSHLLKNKVSLSPGEQIIVLVANDQNMKFSSKNRNFVKLVSTTFLISSQHLKGFLKKSSDINNFNLFYNIDILPLWGSQPFPNHQCKLSNRSNFCSNIWPLTLVPDAEFKNHLVFPGQ